MQYEQEKNQEKKNTQKEQLFASKHVYFNNYVGIDRPTKGVYRALVTSHVSQGT